MLSNSSYKKYLIRLLLLTCTIFLGGTGMGWSQTRKDLEGDKKKLEKEIAQTNQLLQQTRKQRQNTVAELALVNKNINQRTQLINNLNKEVHLTSKEISNLENKIVRMTNDIATLKKEYAQLVVSAHKHRNHYSLLMFVLSSDNFTQALRRIRYIGQYNDYLEKQVALIEEKQEALRSSRDALKTERENQKNLLSQQNAEKQELQKEKNKKNNLVKNLKRKESNLRKDIQAKKKQVDQLNARIKKIIEEEIRKSQEAARKKGQSSSGTSYALTPEEKALSSSFESNKGKLPWPLERGVISGKFGTHPHPVISSISITNNGIDIMTDRGAKARAVFKGEVCNIGSAYGLNFVMIRHGDYITVYLYLDQVYVKNGQKVDTKQDIGRVYYDAEEGKTEMQFQVWKGSTKLNPEYWIAK